MGGEGQPSSAGSTRHQQPTKHKLHQTDIRRSTDRYHTEGQEGLIQQVAQVSGDPPLLVFFCLQEVDRGRSRSALRRRVCSPTTNNPSVQADIPIRGGFVHTSMPPLHCDVTQVGEA